MGKKAQTSPQSGYLSGKPFAEPQKTDLLHKYPSPEKDRSGVQTEVIVKRLQDVETMANNLASLHTFPGGVCVSIIYIGWVFPIISPHTAAWIWICWGIWNLLGTPLHGLSLTSTWILGGNMTRKLLLTAMNVLAGVGPLLNGIQLLVR